jgi:hypothetical protein
VFLSESLSLSLSLRSCRDAFSSHDICLSSAQAAHGYSGWYDFCVAEWGTKWDVEGEIEMEDDTSLILSFSSAWNPPCAALAKMCARDGFRATLHYWEPGESFCGVWEPENARQQRWDLTGLTADQAQVSLPRELEDIFGIVEFMAMQEEEEKERAEEEGEEENDDEDGGEEDEGEEKSAQSDEAAEAISGLPPQPSPPTLPVAPVSTPPAGAAVAGDGHTR